MKALKKVVRGVTLAELWATALTFVIMVVCYFISVVNRNFIKDPCPGPRNWPCTAWFIWP